MIEQESGETCETVAAVRHALVQAWRDALGVGEGPVALIDFPDYGNVGDSAIWLGERRLLQDLGVEVAYSCSKTTYQPSDLAATLDGEGTILLQGGGNFGDIWPRHQALREDIARRFPDVRIIQLPQSIHFTTDDNLERAVSLFAGHANFHFMVRDHAGFALAERISGGRTALSPDAAFSLRLERQAPARLDVLLLLRKDRERAGTEALPRHLLEGLQWRCVDWPPDPFGPNRSTGRLGIALASRSRKVRRRILTAASGKRLTSGYATRRRDHMAGVRLQGGLGLLAQGRVVITDRLHGHILCLLSGIPHVFLDNSYGKVSAFAQTWGTVTGRSRSATSMEEAVVTGRELLAEL